MNEEIKITSEEIFDDEKYILDEQDKKRINNNINILKQQNLPYIEHMRTIPINMTTIIKSKEDVINRLLSDFTLSTFSIYKNEDNIGVINEIFLKLNDRLEIKSVLTDKEIIILDDIIEGLLSKSELSKYSWLLERIPVYLWALGLYSKPTLGKECDINAISKIIFKNSYSDLLKKSNLRSKEEILEFADLIARYHYACRVKRMNDEPLEMYDENVIEEEEEALKWLTSFDLEKLTKDYLNVVCETSKIKFEFKIPYYMSFEDNKESKNELFSLTSRDNRMKIVVSDLGECDKYEFDAKIQRFIGVYNSNGYNIVNKYTLTSNNLDEKIKQFVVERSINDTLSAFNSYFVFINGHIIKMDSLIDSITDYHDYNSLISSSSSSVDMDILLSIKNITITEDKEINSVLSGNNMNICNEFDYSNIIPSISNISKIVELCSLLYDKFDSVLLNHNVHEVEKGDNCNFEIIIIDNEYKKTILTSFNEFNDNISLLNNINVLTIKLSLGYIKLNEEYNNLFEITIRPYSIVFKRLSNHEQSLMSQIEDSINNNMKKLTTEKTIFNK